MKNPAHRHPNPAAGGNHASLARWILLVDDEPTVRKLIEEILTHANLTVRAAEGAAAALKLAESAPTPPSLLITDVLMPGIDGLTLTRQMLVRLPRLKVILISGHLSDIAWWPDDLRGVRFITKPFAHDELLLAVTEALTDSASDR
jgi:two-component system cell cycle sensor histidine kinase/response regulator CckA